MRRPRRAQQGWVGLLVLLLAILIVAWLSKDALLSYGLAGKPAATAAEPGAPPTPTDARQRARNVEQTVIDEARIRQRMLNERENDE